MPTPPFKPDSGLFQALEPTAEALALHDAGRRMFLTQDPGEIVRILCEAVDSSLRPRATSVFLVDPATGELSGGDPGLLPEPAVIAFVFEEAKPPTIPHGEGRFITVFPLRVPQRRVGVLVLDVTGMAEEVSRANLDPVLLLSNQAAAALHNAHLVSRTLGESSLLQNILDSINNALVTLDNMRNITRLNRNAMAMFEITGEAQGRHYADVFPPEVVAAVSSLLQETEQFGVSMEKMVAARPGQGLEIRIAASISTLHDETFTPLGYIVVFRDMTASHELDRLRKLDTMKSEFVANVSHELKTPLTSIKAYTEALLDMAADGQMKSFLRVIDEESDRLLYLINDLLNVSRIQSGKMKMHFAPASPRSIVEEVLSISRVHSERHTIVQDIPDGLPELLVDKEKMKEVMINLLSNAIKYSPKGGTVRISMRAEEGNFRIEVKDDGIGIPKEHQEKIFQAFYRVDSSHTAEIPGTGLGLVIVKAIVEQHGGKIWLVSEPGKGTTVIVLLPVRRTLKQGDAGYDMGSMA